MICLYRSQYHHNSKPGMDEAGFIWSIWLLFFGSIGIVGCWIEILGAIGYENDVLFEFRLSRRFRISSVASSISCSLISLYIWYILWNISHAGLGSICLTLLLLMLYTFTNNVLLFFLCVSYTSSIQLTRFINQQIYLDDELAVISLVDCRALTAFMKIAVRILIY